MARLDQLLKLWNQGLLEDVLSSGSVGGLSVGPGVMMGSSGVQTGVVVTLVVTFGVASPVGNAVLVALGAGLPSVGHTCGVGDAVGDGDGVGDGVGEGDGVGVGDGVTTVHEAPMAIRAP